MQSIPLKIQEILSDKVLLSHKLLKVEKDGNEWISTFQTKSGVKKIRSTAVLMTSPAYVTAEILGLNTIPEAKELENIVYPPVASVTIAYPNEVFKEPLVGFGNLIPRAMKIRTLGTIWSSSLFPVSANVIPVFFALFY